MGLTRKPRRGEVYLLSVIITPPPTPFIHRFRI